MGNSHFKLPLLEFFQPLRFAGELTFLRQNGRNLPYASQKKQIRKGLTKRRRNVGKTQCCRLFHLLSRKGAKLLNSLNFLSLFSTYLLLFSLEFLHFRREILGRARLTGRCHQLPFPEINDPEPLPQDDPIARKTITHFLTNLFNTTCPAVYFSMGIKKRKMDILSKKFRLPPCRFSKTNRSICIGTYTYLNT